MSAILFERYGKRIPMQLADSELQHGGAIVTTLSDDDYHGPLMV